MGGEALPGRYPSASTSASRLVSELDVEREEASLRAQGGDALSLSGIEPVQDFDHALADYGCLRTAD